ncbi:hypothetical protein ACXM2N_03890 [Corynebacterium sp. ZY180755]
MTKTIIISLCAAVALTACSTNSSDTAQETTQTSAAAPESSRTEVATLPTRVVISYDGGLLTIDPKTGETLADEKIDGFTRLNNADDNRNVFVTRGDQFQLFDSGLVTQEHGDHNHYYTQSPALTDEVFDAPKAGHVVHHDGLTALFSDGTGNVTVFPSDDPSQTTTIETGEAHHGVAVPFADGSIVYTVGNEDDRHTIRHVDKDNTTIAETTDCPNVHGEAMAANGNVVFGCTNGPVVYNPTEKKFHKIDVSAFAGKEGYQRSGNLAGSEESNIILGDNKTEEDAELERPTSVTLIDAQNYTAKEVELGSSYWFRSLARGDGGEAIMLTYDGNLNIIDPETAEITKIPAIGEWKEKEEWQLPGPILKVHENKAYVTDANTNELVVVDLTTKETTKHKLDVSPVEMAVL